MPRLLCTGQDSTNLAMLCCTAEGWEGLLGHWGQVGEGCSKPCPLLALGCQGDTVPFLPAAPSPLAVGLRCRAASGAAGTGLVGRSAGGLGPCSCPLPAADHLSFN